MEAHARAEAIQQLQHTYEQLQLLIDLVERPHSCIDVIRQVKDIHTRLEAAKQLVIEDHYNDCIRKIERFKQDDDYASVFAEVLNAFRSRHRY